MWSCAFRAPSLRRPFARCTPCSTKGPSHAPVAVSQSGGTRAVYEPNMKHLNWFSLASTLALSLTLIPHPVGTATMAPKAYIGLFKDNAVAVFDTGSNQVTKTIPIATGPHGLVITPDAHWVYASSDGDA